MLVIVTIVVVLASLAGFSFVALMSTEHKAIRLRGQEQQLDAALASAVEYLKVLIAQPVTSGDSSFSSSSGSSDWYDRPDLFRAVPLTTDGPGSEIRFSVISPRIEGESLSGIRFGLVDESSRLNLLALVEWDRQKAGTARQALMNLPGMTEAIADALLDWVDKDAQPRPLGAESDYYASLDPPYDARNGAPESLEELLLVRDVTRVLLFGADVNWNYQVDPQEQQMAAAEAVEMGSAEEGALPWAHLLTVFSAEKNIAPDGQPRINVNDSDLSRLYARLTELLGEERARFVIALRQYGPYDGSQPPMNEDEFKLDLSVRPRYSLNSLLDLIDRRVRVPQTKPRIVLESPFRSDPQSVQEYLPLLVDYLTLTDAKVLIGRINVNQAPRPVLMAIPGLSGDQAERIIAARGAESGWGQGGSRNSVAWLVTENVIDLDTFGTILPFLTTRGDVYRAQIVSFVQPDGMMKRAEVVIDGTGRFPRQVYWKDLGVLGSGFTREAVAGRIDETGFAGEEF